MSSITLTTTEVDTTAMALMNVSLTGSHEPSQEEIEFIGALPEACYGPIKFSGECRVGSGNSGERDEEE